MLTHEAPRAAPERRAAIREGAWPVFAILFALMVVDFVDRFVVVSMLPHLKTEWALGDGQLGALVSIVSVTVAIGTVPLSLVADRWGLVKSVFAMAVVWSGATIACAFAGSYGQLLAARAFVGLGEAAYGPAGAALLANRFPGQFRTGVLGAFFAASLIGSVLGVALGGVIAERWGWQAGFGAVGIPGLLLAVVFLLVVRDDASAGRARPSGTWIGARAASRALFRPRTLVLACIGGALQLALVSSVFTWLPSFLHRNYGLAPDVAGVRTGFIVLVGGVGAIAWSLVADLLAPAHPRARLHVSALAAVASAVLFGAAFALVGPGSAQIALIVAGAFAMTGTIGPVAAVVLDVAPPALRATAASVLALVQNLAGLAAGPLVAGILSDRLGLPFALSLMPACCVLAAAVFVVAARHYVADRGEAERQAVAAESALPDPEARVGGTAAGV